MGISKSIIQEDIPELEKIMNQHNERIYWISGKTNAELYMTKYVLEKNIRFKI